MSLTGHPNGYGVQPSAECASRVERPGLTHQGEKGCLKRVFAVSLAREDAPADAPHQRGVPIDDLLERDRVALADEPPQQLGVGLRRTPQTPGTQMPKLRREGGVRHGPFLRSWMILPFLFHDRDERPGDFSLA